MNGLVLAGLIWAGAGTFADRVHPIHSSTLSIRETGGLAALEVSLRAFVEDFPPGANPTAIDRYIEARVTLADRSGTVVPLRYRAHRIENGLLVVALAASAPPGGLAGGTVENRLVQEKFADQVNVVELIIDGRRQVLVHVGRDGAKRIR